jgi:hypothetical protein
VVIALTIGIAIQTWPACRTEAWQKLNWRVIAQRIAQYAKPGDVVIAAGNGRASRSTTTGRET